MDYWLHILIMTGIFTMLTQSLSLCAGKAGLISLSHAGFFGIAAYTAALLSIHSGSSLFIELVLAMFICGLCAYLAGSIALNTVSDYFIICTLSLQFIVVGILNNWSEVTRGPIGISDIPPARIWGIVITEKFLFLLITAFLATAIWLYLKKLFKSGFGNILEALAEDEIFTQSIGKNVFQAKKASFILSAILAAVPGVLYAHYMAYIDPTSFTLDESIFMLAIVIIGNFKNLTHCFLACAFMILLPEMLRFVGMPQNISANCRQIIFGIILVVITVYKFPKHRRQVA